MTVNLPNTRIGSYGLIVEEQKILLCRLSKQVPHLEGLWTLPGGGLEFGEDPETALVREVEEETGFTVKPTSLAGVDSLHDPEATPEFHGIRIIYFASTVSGSLRHEASGTTDAASWFHHSELENLPLLGLAKTGIAHAFA